jgi:LDH2 family malate/lactate/ureidoglycolate dehydrogenase
MPGERRLACRDDRRRNGVPLAPALVAQLEKLAKDLGIETLQSRASSL